ncbi:FAD binding domain-containing protein [Apiospora kogelbergensis]|uniref:FAD binding domain-containing protein n=1 Tax=Apiospora kogelbergensis TaxID=1337665 RepID=A0AAW0QGQ9_9PEZI
MARVSRILLPALGLFASLPYSVYGQLLPAAKTTLGRAAETLSGSWSSGDAASLQLTEAVLQNLTNANVDVNIDISLFGFPKNGTEQGKFPACKTYPGDELWPSASEWDAFDQLTGGALIKTVPIGAACYPGHESYNAEKCQEILDGWHDSEVHVRDPTSVMSPLFQGETCMPQNGNSSSSNTCKIGGFPQYVVNVTTVAQIQLAVNFARNANMRLVVHNTGHDFFGKSVGAGALSVWTHHLKSSEFVEELKTPSYTGPALKVGSGIQIHDLYELTRQLGYTAVGGECKGVGATGGYMAGGGHGPLMSLYGMGADSVLSLDVVLPDGRFVTADENQNTDLFWALRGGGGSTFGVVTGMTLMLHPASSFSGVTFELASGPGTENSNDVFWAAMYAYWRKFPSYAEKHTYGYSIMFPTDTGFTWSMLPWLVPGMPLAEFKDMVAPLFAEWTALGLNFTPNYFEHDNWYDTWKAHFPTENVAVDRVRTASRLFPKKNWADQSLLNATMDAVRSIIEEGSALVQYNIQGLAPEGTPESAINPAWREAVMFGIIGYAWSELTTKEEFEAGHRRISRDWMERLRKVTPGGGGYLNEGDVMEPNPGQAFLRLTLRAAPGHQEGGRSLGCLLGAHCRRLRALVCDAPGGLVDAPNGKTLSQIMQLPPRCP